MMPTSVQLNRKSVWELAVALFMLSLVVTPAVAVSAGSVSILNPKGSGRGILMGTSSNWSGYAIAGQNHSVTDVKGTWIVPAIVGTCPTKNSTSSSFWVGMDGLTSGTVEQMGTTAACVNGAPAYSAWIEYYPIPRKSLTKITVSPGDVMSVELKYNGTALVFSMSDLTAKEAYTSSVPGILAMRSSAEWVAEDPSNLKGPLPLANFGVVSFGGGSGATSSADMATVSGVTGSIGAFGSSVVRIQMINSAGALKASPSLLSPSGSGFSVSWVSAGP